MAYPTDPVPVLLIPADLKLPMVYQKAYLFFGAGNLDCPDLATSIKADWIEVVRPAGLKDARYGSVQIVMIVDEEGVLRDKPMNARASWLYQTHFHGHPIRGDALLVGEGPTDDSGEMDLVPLPAPFTQEKWSDLWPPQMLEP